MNQEKGNKKFDVKILIIIIVVLAVALIGIGGYLNFSKMPDEKSPQKETNEEQQKESTRDIEFDAAYVNEQLNQYIGYFLTYQIPTNSYEKNLLETNTARGIFVNAIFMINQNFTWYNNENASSFPYVDIKTYEEEYKKVYGDYYTMEEDSEDGATFYKSREGSVAYNALGSTDYIVWNAFENSGKNCTLNADKITYNTKTKEYSMTGTYQLTEIASNISETGTFTIVYSSNQEEQAAIKSIICHQ